MEEIDKLGLVRQYALIIKPIVGEGELFTRLVEGLEGLLIGEKVTPSLDRSIDYEAMVKEGIHKGTISRIRRHLSDGGPYCNPVEEKDKITTYGGLLDFLDAWNRGEVKDKRTFGQGIMNVIGNHLKVQGYLR